MPRRRLGAAESANIPASRTAPGETTETPTPVVAQVLAQAEREAAQAELGRRVERSVRRSRPGPRSRRRRPCGPAPRSTSFGKQLARHPHGRLEVHAQRPPDLLLREPVERARARAGRRWRRGCRSSPASASSCSAAPSSREVGDHRAVPVARQAAASSSSCSALARAERSASPRGRRGPRRSRGPRPPVAPVSSAVLPRELHAAEPTDRRTGAYAERAGCLARRARRLAAFAGGARGAARSPAAGAGGDAARPRPCCRRARAGYVSIAGVADGTGSPHLTDQVDAVRELRVQAVRVQPARRDRDAAPRRRDHPRLLRRARRSPRRASTTPGGASATRSPRTGSSSSSSSGARRPAGSRRSSARRYLDDDLIARRDYYTDAEIDAMIAGVPAELRTRAEAYRDGINAWIEHVSSSPSDLPGEFAALGVPIERLDAARHGPGRGLPGAHGALGRRRRARERAGPRRACGPRLRHPAPRPHARSADHRAEGPRGKFPAQPGPDAAATSGSGSGAPGSSSPTPT